MLDAENQALPTVHIGGYRPGAGCKPNPNTPKRTRYTLLAVPELDQAIQSARLLGESDQNLMERLIRSALGLCNSEASSG
jgi:hypothetical protein